MELGTVLSVIQTLLSVLQTEDLKKSLSIFGYKSQLDDLKETVKTIKAVLCDTEAKQQLTAQEQNFIEKLKDAAFEADDLFDEVLTLAAQKKLLMTDGDLSRKLTNFFSPSKNTFTMSRKIKRVKNKLDAIAYDRQFTVPIDHEPIKKRSLRETCSYVNEAEIIGRQGDLDNIVGKLLASHDSNRNDVSVLSVVGIGGLGKTALAQLVYNDPRVTNAFPLKMWTCVADQDQKVLDVKNILCKILASLTKKNPDQGSTMDQVQSQLLNQIDGKKYLLVLDDVWTENREQWCEFVKYLFGYKTDSSILVTTRSQNTAAIAGGQIHELSGLSDEDSRRLFERTAFPINQPNPPELVSIGRKIVDECAGVPLAIRVARSLLYGQGKDKWMKIQEIGLANIRDSDNGILPILELSFHHLESPLKNCFRYCALFSKDYKIKKEVLLRLWMAQGYIVELDKGQSIENVAEEYFSILLKRCFSQDIEKNEEGEIVSCKIHDLMHDIAQKVSGKEIYSLNTISGNVDKNVRHLSNFNLSQLQKYYFSSNTHIRSLFSFDYEFHCELAGDTLVKSFKYLRVLSLNNKNIKCLPESIGELLHLRYMDLSWSRKIEALPNSITKLCNLQTLILYRCEKLKELPKDLSRLVKLRVLDIECCVDLRCMPRGMGKMTCLQTMKGWYILGGEGRPRCKSWKQWFDMLEDLKLPINLKGVLEIRVLWPEKNLKNDVKEGSLRKGLYLKCLEHLQTLKLEFEGGEDSIEDLQPHSNLERLLVLHYNGLKFPNWFLPNLVFLTFQICQKLKYLPWLGNLCHLKFLILWGLPELEYIEIEEESREVASTSSTPQKLSFYPSLEHLQLNDLPKWKGWRRGGFELEETSNNNDDDNNDNNIVIPQVTMQLCLPQLKILEIEACEEFTSCSLLCPMLETLELRDFNEGMQIKSTITNDEKSSPEPAIDNPAGSTLHLLELRDLTVSKGACLDSIPIESFQSLQELFICGDDEMVELPNNLQYSSALQTLQISYCENLKAMPNWMPKLTSLKELRIWNCSKSLKKRCQKDPPGEDWPLIQHIPVIINFKPREG